MGLLSDSACALIEGERIPQASGDTVELNDVSSSSCGRRRVICVRTSTTPFLANFRIAGDLGVGGASKTIIDSGCVRLPHATRPSRSSVPTIEANSVAQL